MTRQVKSKQRVAEHGEVFTAEREVEAMCDLVKQETERIDSRFLEPSCGDGNFLSVILKRKLAIVTQKYRHSMCDWERNALMALGSLYGVDILQDNVIACRERLFAIWDGEYRAVCKNTCDETREAARFLLSRNIVCGNALTLLCVDGDGCEQNTPIVLSEWSFPFHDDRMQRKDYTFAELLAAEDMGNRNEDKQEEGVRLQQYITHYRQIFKGGQEQWLAGTLLRFSTEVFSMKFDVIIGNPPYQLSDGGNANSATPIYQEFVEQAIKMDPRFLTMIIPARWFMGGRGLDTFRKTMLHDDRIRVIHDFPNASDCFPGVEIKGGVCYFLWNRDERGLCEVHSHYGERERITVRPLLEEGMETFIRNDTQISVLNKVRAKQEPSFSQWLNAGRYFGFHTKVEWDAEKEYGRIQTADGKSFVPMRATRAENADVKVYVHGGICWIARESVPKHQDAIGQYKVIIPRSGNPGSSILGKPKLSEPNTCSSNTYVVAIPPTGALSKSQAENILHYLTTKFVRFLIATRTSTQDMPPKAYSFVPLQDFSETWTDERLYRKYSLTEDEIREIETRIPAMEV